MKISHYISFFLFSICLVSCHDYLCDGFGSSTEIIQNKEFETRQLKVGQVESIDLNNYWYFQHDTGCEITRVDRGSENIKIQDTTIAKFVCPDRNTELCSDSTWQDPKGDNVFKLKALQAGSTQVDINLTWSGDYSPAEEDFNFQLNVID